jgi:hypothetical protein
MTKRRTTLNHHHADRRWGVLDSFRQTGRPADRQTGGALAVAGFGALVAHRATFVPGLHASVLIAFVLLTVTILATLTLPRVR